MTLQDKIEIAQFNFEKKYRFIAFWTNPFYLMRKKLYLNIKELAPLLKGSVLDFGCGSKPYQELFTNCTEYIGVDIEQSGHSHLEESIDYYYDGKVLPFKDCSFDNVFSSEVIEHIDNLDEILDEIYRVIKPNGLFFLTTPFVWNENEVPFDYARYNSYGLEKILNRHGFYAVEKRKSLNYIEIIYQMKAEYYRGLFDRFHSIHADRFVRLTFVPMQTVKGLILGKLLPKDESLYGNNVFLFQKKG